MSHTQIRHYNCRNINRKQQFLPMPKFTIIANISTPTLHLSIGNKAASSIFAELINGNPEDDTVKHLQIASQQFKERLQLLDDIGEQMFIMKRFFNDIPTDQHFLFLPGHITDELEIYQQTKKLSLLDRVEHVFDNGYDKFFPYLYNHYEVHSFHSKDRLNVGVNKREKRVCRFCGKSMPDVMFKQKAHAISEALGNKGLVCLEECDDCNRRFNETIEQDLIRISQLNLLLYGIKGKNGIPTFKGNNVTIINKTSTRSTIGRDTMLLKVDTLPETRNPQEIGKYLSEKASSTIEYIPQNIYKCLCKYVLSLIDSKYIPHFKRTIDWINEPLSKHRLPPVWYCQVPIGSSPIMIILQRKHNHKEIPYCWAILNIVGWQYLFILPFCSLDKYKFVGKSRVDFFIEGIKKMMSNIELHTMNLDGIKHAKFHIKANFEISPDCVEGRDYFFIDRNKNPEDWPEGL